MIGLLFYAESCLGGVKQRNTGGVLAGYVLRNHRVQNGTDRNGHLKPVNLGGARVMVSGAQSSLGTRTHHGQVKSV